MEDYMLCQTRQIWGIKVKKLSGRLYINGKQKISSSGTKNLDEAIPILKWFDDVQLEHKIKIKLSWRLTKKIQMKILSRKIVKLIKN